MRDFNVQMNIGPAIRGLKKFGADVGNMMQFIMHDQARLLALDAIKYSAPWDNGAPGTGSKVRVAGESALSGDLQKIFKPIDNESAIARWLIEAGKSGKDFVRYDSKKRKLVFKSALVNDAMDKMKAWHLQHRNKRGRVVFKEDKSLAWGGKQLVPSKLFWKYYKQEAQRVGELKAGWLPSVRHFALLSRGPARVPAWITRHATPGGASGSVGRNGTGRLVLTNRAHHGSAIRDSAMRAIVGIRERSMKSYTAKRLQQICDQFNIRFGGGGGGAGVAA